MIMREPSHCLLVQRSKYLQKVRGHCCILIMSYPATVLKEVENLVSKLRSDLQKQLLQNPTTFETQKKLIKLVIEIM